MLRDALWFHALFFALATPSLLLAPRLAPVTLALSLAYAGGLLLVAVVRRHALWLSLLGFLLPLCAALLLPLAALVLVTQTLRYAFGTPGLALALPLHMALLWLLPLFPLLLIGARRSLPTLLLLAVPVFALWEWGGPRLGLWTTPGVTRLHGLALAPLAADLFLVLAAASAYRQSAHRGWSARLWASGEVALRYAGAYLVAFLAVEYIFHSALLGIL